MLTQIETQALDMLLAGDDDRLVLLRAQLKAASVTRRESTGAGFFTDLSVPAHIPRLAARKRFVIGDLYAEMASLQHPAGFVLFVTEGALACLECFIVDGRWSEAAALRRAYYVHPATPESATLVETEERDLGWALREAV